MSTSRYDASVALFELLKTSFAYPVSSRRFTSWDQVSDLQKPALFMVEYEETHIRARAQTPALRTLMAKVIILIGEGQDPNTTPIDVLNSLIDAIDPVSGGVLKPDNILAQRQTLGGLVYDCYIEGVVTKVPGDIDGEGMAILPIKLIFDH